MVEFGEIVVNILASPHTEKIATNILVNNNLPGAFSPPQRGVMVSELIAQE